jgi:chemotaxis protein CheD
MTETGFRPQAAAKTAPYEAGRDGILRVVDIAAMLISDNPNDVLVTYSLGSCVGLSLYDPELRLGGIIHCMLPLSSIDKAKADANPFMFADAGISKMLQTLFNMGAVRRRLVAKAAGAAAPLDEKGLFRIGERNHAVMRKILWKNEILLAAEAVGGTAPRTMYLRICDGKLTIRSKGTETEL